MYLRRIILSIASLFLASSPALVSTASMAQADEAVEEKVNAAASLDELLERVKSDKLKDRSVNEKREKTFIGAKNRQAELLKQAKDELNAERRRADELKLSFETNEKSLAELEDKLRITMGTLGELFGVVRQVAGDTKAQFENSVISAQYPGRTEAMDSLAQRKELAETPDLERLWADLLMEMTESGKVTSFPGKVTLTDGSEKQTQVIRVGSFNLIADGGYLRYSSEVSEMIELARQPQGRYLSMVDDFEGAAAGSLVALGVDPLRGSILELLVQAPSLWERFQQGGVVGYVIACVLAIGLIIVVERFVYLSKVGAQIKAQLVSNVPDPSNPLGKIFAVYQEYKDKDIESLELKLDEAILKGTASLERGLSTIKILASVAPLLGLLGTVTGMIVTFQSITLFGTGDPKLMAGGISQALITTVLGLIAAIPLILLHSVVASKSKTTLAILEEQSAGLMAQRVELEAGS